MLLRLLPSDTTTRRQLIEACLERLIPLQDFFHHQRSFAFYSSSILVIYEGDPDGVVADIPTPPPVDDADVSSSVDDGLTYRKFPTTPNPLSSYAQKLARPLPRDLIDSNCHTQSATTRDSKKEDDVNDQSQILVKDSSTDLEGVGSFSRHIDRCREHSPWFSSALRSDSDDCCESSVSPARDSPSHSICSFVCSSSSDSSSSASSSPSSSSTPSSASPQSRSPDRACDPRQSTANSRHLPPRLYLIDFAHAYRLDEVGLTSDQGCARGLDNLVAHFKSFLRLCP